MSTIPQVAIKIIKSQPYLAEALVEGLINISSLARKIQPQVEREVGKPIKLGALVMALNRLMPKLEESEGIKSSEIAKVEDISVRSNLVSISYRNSDALLKKHTDLMNCIRENQECYYTFMQSVFKSNIIVSATLKDKIDAIFEGETVLDSNKNLSAVILRLPKDKNQIGLYYFILRKIAWAGINVEEVVSITNEITLVVNDYDIDKTFSVLKSVSNI